MRSVGRLERPKIAEKNNMESVGYCLLSVVCAGAGLSVIVAIVTVGAATGVLFDERPVGDPRILVGVAIVFSMCGLVAVLSFVALGLQFR